MPATVSAVDDAYGKVEAVVVVAVKYAPTTWPTTESFAYGDVVPIPTFPPVKSAEKEALEKVGVPVKVCVPFKRAMFAVSERSPDAMVLHAGLFDEPEFLRKELAVTDFESAEKVFAAEP